MAERVGDGILPGDREELPQLEDGDHKWLRIVQRSYEASTDFLDDSIRSEWESALSRFHSEHPPLSKYHSPAYKGRSKIFRPKTRSLSRRAEAKAARALFSNTDLIDVRGQNRGDAIQADAARFRKSLLQYRLEHSIPWFLTCMGARQDTFNYGICVSLSTWSYKVEEEARIVPEFDDMGQPLVDPETGEELGREETISRVVEDKPIIDLLPPENVRFDANADWRNPIEDSPVVTVMLPMGAHKVLERMQRPNPVTGQPEWREYTLAQIIAASQDKNLNEVVRQARVGKNRQDPLDILQGDEFSQVWVYLNIVRDGLADYAFYTLGSRLMLTDPAPVEQVLPLGRDSITFGFSVVEAHRPYPLGGNKLAAPLQAEINDVTNQRMDNVKLALNKRYILKRGAQIDTAALMRSTPGGGVMAGDVDGDIRVLDFPDVTGSSYQEQDRLAQELDELTGNFSSSSVQANRSLNETVGGMNLLQGDASEVSEYELRTFVETWVEPVLRKLDKLIAMFETDAVIKQVAAENADLQLYGQSEELDRLLDDELVVSVNVGMGNTNPMQRLQQFQTIVGSVAAIPELAQRLNPEEIGKEIFSLGGFSDSTRFFRSEEEMQALMEQAAQMQPQDNSLQVAQLKAEASLQETQIKAQADMQIAQLKASIDSEANMQDYEAKMAKIVTEANTKLKDLYEKMNIERDKLQATRDVTAAKEGGRIREMNLRRDTGAGI
jgi:hypothetical protein